MNRENAGGRSVVVEKRAEAAAGVPLGAHRIHARVALTVHPLQLERLAKQACDDTWRNVRNDLKHRKVATIVGPEPAPSGIHRPRAVRRPIHLRVRSCRFVSGSRPGVGRV